jgi:RNA polymerase sigma-70 factor (sigma-E family)
MRVNEGEEASGEQELAVFAAREHTRLVALLTLQVGDVYTAQELSQDAIARLCQHWTRVRKMDNPQAWLTRVALNLATSRLRRRLAERRASQRFMQTAGPAEPPQDEAAAIAIRDVLKSLPPRQRTVLVLRFYEDLSVSDTAVLMGCAEGTVKSLTSKAVAGLRRGTEDWAGTPRREATA